MKDYNASKDPNGLITIKDFAKMLNVSIGTARRRLVRDMVPHGFVGRLLRIRRADAIYYANKVRPWAAVFGRPYPRLPA
jgi:hypothetical protein